MDWLNEYKRSNSKKGLFCDPNHITRPINAGDLELTLCENLGSKRDYTWVIGKFVTYFSWWLSSALSSPYDHLPMHPWCSCSISHRKPPGYPHPFRCFHAYSTHPSHPPIPVCTFLQARDACSGSICIRISHLLFRKVPGVLFLWCP